MNSNKTSSFLESVETKNCFINKTFQGGGYMIPFCQDKAITWEKFLPTKRNSGSGKEGSRLSGMKLLEFITIIL